MEFKIIFEIAIFTATLLTVVTCELQFEQISPEENGLKMPNFVDQESITRTTSIAPQIYKQNPGIPCGLPPFVDQMPKVHREELKKVWQSYQLGKDCGLQQAQTFEIVNKLSNEDRFRIFGPLSDIATAPVIVPELGVPIVPMFIRTSSPQTKQLFDSILTNDTMEDSEKFVAMEKLAPELLSPGQIVDFKLWINKLKIRRANIDARIDALSDEASQILKKITELRIREKKILQSLTPKIAVELSGLI